MKQFLIDRLQEGSTVRALILFVCSFGGIQITTDQTTQIVLIITAITGLIQSLVPDTIKALTKKKEEPQLIVEKEPKYTLVEVPKENSVDWERLHNN